MYLKFFGNFLLNHGVITSDQLMELLKLQSTSQIHLESRVIHDQLMTGREVEDVRRLQAIKMKSFSELIVSEGYLTSAQLEELLATNTPDFLTLGQNLVEKNIVTAMELQNLITDYQSEYEIDDFDLVEEQKKSILELTQNFYQHKNILPEKYITQYINLLFSNLQNFIGRDFSILQMIQLPECPVDVCVTQSIVGKLNLLTAIEMDSTTAVAFSSRYLKSEDQPLPHDENLPKSLLAKECLADFLNLQNGLFSVNMSNDYSIDLDLSAPEAVEHTMLSAKKTYFLMPIAYTFGTVHIIISFL